MHLHNEWFTLPSTEIKFAILTLNNDYLVTAISCCTSVIPCHYYESLQSLETEQLQKDDFSLSIVQVPNLMAHESLNYSTNSKVKEVNRIVGSYPGNGEINSGYQALELRGASLSGYAPVMSCLLSTGIFQDDTRDGDGRTLFPLLAGREANHQEVLSFLASRPDINVD